MKNLALKGSALIMAIMISLISLILLSGLFAISGYTLNQSGAIMGETAMYYAAEAGLNHAVYGLRTKNNTIALFEAGSNTTALSGSIGTINGYAVNVTTTFNLTATSTAAVQTYKIVSTASKDGKTLTLTFDDVGMDNMGSNTWGNTGSMLSSLALASGDQMLGPMIFGGTFNFSGNPLFKGKVTSYSTLDSRNSANDYTLTPILKTCHAGAMTKGVVDKDDRSNYKSAVEAIFQGGYSQKSGALPDWSKYVGTWVQFQSTIDNATSTDLPSIKSPAAYSTNISVKFENDKVKISTDGTNFSDLDTTYNTILVSGTNTVSLLGGKVPRNFTIVTEQGDVRIKGDVYYDGLDSYKDMQPSDINVNKAKDIQDAITSSMPKFAIIAGLNCGAGSTEYSENHGNVLIDPEYITNSPGGTASVDGGYNKYSNSLLFNGFVYAPKGHFGMDKNKSSDYQVAGVQKLDNQGRPMFDRWGQPIWVSAPKITSIPVMTIGSIIAYTKGQFRTGSGTEWAGINAVFANDKRASGGMVPLGYRAVVEKVDNVDRMILKKDVKYSVSKNF